MKKHPLTDDLEFVKRDKIITCLCSDTTSANFVQFELHRNIAFYFGSEKSNIWNYEFEELKPKSSLKNLVPRKCFIYSDLAMHQFLGDIKARILRVVSLPIDEETRKCEATIIFQNPHYVTLDRDHFQTTHLYIKTIDGLRFPFDIGSLIAKLHIRKRI